MNYEYFPPPDPDLKPMPPEAKERLMRDIRNTARAGWPGALSRRSFW